VGARKEITEGDRNHLDNHKVVIRMKTPFMMLEL